MTARAACPWRQGRGVRDAAQTCPGVNMDGPQVPGTRACMCRGPSRPRRLRSGFQRCRALELGEMASISELRRQSQYFLRLRVQATNYTVFEVPVTSRLESPVLAECGSCCRRLNVPFQSVAQLKR